jgi:hypothetical protein
MGQASFRKVHTARCVLAQARERDPSGEDHIRDGVKQESARLATYPHVALKLCDH